GPRPCRLKLEGSARFPLQLRSRCRRLEAVVQIRWLAAAFVRRPQELEGVRVFAPAASELRCDPLFPKPTFADAGRSRAEWKPPTGPAHDPRSASIRRRRGRCGRF